MPNHRTRGGRTAARLLAASFFLVSLLLFAGQARAQQDLGHKTLGTLGMKAGSQPEPGIYLADQFVRYRATSLVDKNGDTLPIPADLNALAAGFGVAVAVELPQPGTYLNASVGFPIAHVTANTARPEASIDRFGLGDLYVQPFKLGWRTGRLDVVSGYGFYAPTGGFEPGGNDGVGRGSWTHQLSLGSTIFFDEGKTWHLSALGSFDLNMGKRHVDITRGPTLQVQGGFGVTVRRIVDLGVAVYGIWQVADDRGADLPPVLAGRRDRAYGAGPELQLKIPPIQSSLVARYEHDFGVASRPEGEIFLIGLRVMLWKPKKSASKR